MQPSRPGAVGRATLSERVAEAFGVELVSAVRVGGGAESGAALWRAATADGRSFAVKLSRSGMAAGLLAATHLAERGLRGVPAPLRTRDGRPWTSLDGGQLAVVPWVAGRRAVDGGLSADQWRSFGSLLAQLHGVAVPTALRAALPTEDYHPAAASAVRALDERVGAARRTGDPLKRALVEEWRAAAAAIAILPQQAETLGAELRRRPAPVALCHSDAHTLNLLVADDGELWLIDWDGAILAPPERDLMFIVDGVIATALVLPAEQACFFDGYGATGVDPTLLAYYRCAWALEDLAGFASEILDDPFRTEGERAQALAYFRSLLSPTGIVPLALAALREIGRPRR